MIYKQIEEDIIEPIGDITINDFIKRNKAELISLVGDELVIIQAEDDRFIMITGKKYANNSLGERQYYKNEYGNRNIENMGLGGSRILIQLANKKHLQANQFQ